MLLSYLRLSTLICVYGLQSFALQLSITGQAAINGAVTLVWERGGGDPMLFFLRSVKTDKSPSTISEQLDIGDISGDANTVQIPFNQTGTFEFQAFAERNQTTGFFSKSSSFRVETVASVTQSAGDGLASTSPHDVGQTTLSLASTTLHEVTESTISTESMPSVSLISSITPTVTAVPMSPTRQSGQAAEHTHRTSIIVGATIVAVLVLVMAPFSIWYFARRHRTSNTLSEVHDTVEQFLYVPTMSLSNTVIGLEGGERDRDPRREKTHITPPIDSLIHPAPQSPAAARSSLLSPPPISPNALVSNSPQMNLDNEAAAGSLSLRVQMEELSFNPEWSTMGPPPPYVSEGDVIIRQGDT